MEKTLRNKIRSEYVKGIPRETRQTRDMTINCSRKDLDYALGKRVFEQRY